MPTKPNLFIVGFAKKILLANPVGGVADAVFAADNPLSLDAWVGVIAYAFQIYFDFCGYSDMAVGLGRMLGFEFLRNFDAPYRSGRARTWIKVRNKKAPAYTRIEDGTF